MKEEDAIALLSQISGCPGDRDTLLKIASALDFQPLALACAAVDMHRIFKCPDQCKAKWSNYLFKLQEGKREATEEICEKNTSTNQSAMTAAVRLALEKVVSEDKIMMHALQFLSVLANEPIPLKYVVQYVINCMPDEDQDVVSARISLSSLVISSEVEEISKEIRVHQVVYHGLQKCFENNEKDILQLMSVFSDLVSFKNAYSITKEEIIATRSFALHFVVISRKLNLHLLDHSSIKVECLTADCLFKAGSICLVQGYYKASEIFLELCLSIQQRAYNSGAAMVQDRNLNINIPAMNKSHEDKQSQFEGKLTCSDDVGIALSTTLKSLGHLYINISDYKKAQIHLEAALVIEEKLHKGDNLEIAITLKNLGLCLVRLGEHGNAEACLQRALAIQGKVWDKNDILLADILINIVWLLQSQREFVKAKKYCERLLELEQTLYGRENPQLGDTINDLGLCFANFKSNERAAGFYEKALKIAESLYHANHPNIAITLGNFGRCLLTIGKHERARGYLEKALVICENGNDENDPRLVDILNMLGLCTLEQKQYEKAKAYLERALSIQENGENENDPRIGNTLYYLGLFFYEQRQYEKAKAYLERALSIDEKGKGENNLELAITLDILGSCLFKQRQLGN